MKTDSKTFLGTVEACLIDERTIVLRFICHEIRDDFSGQVDKMPYDRMPMATMMKRVQITFDSQAVLSSLKSGDIVALTVMKWQDSSVTYEVKNLTLQQKYQDVRVYVGDNANLMLSAEPHSEKELAQPAKLPKICY